MSWSNWGWDMVTSSIAGVGEVISEVNETFVKPTMDEMSDHAIKICMQSQSLVPHLRLVNDVAEMIDVPEEEREHDGMTENDNGFWLIYFFVVL
jgi:hypothetical protein